MVIAEYRRRIAATRTQFVFRDLLGAGRLAMGRLDLLWGNSLRQRVNVQTRIRAIYFWTDCSVRIFVDATKVDSLRSDRCRNMRRR